MILYFISKKGGKKMEEKDIVVLGGLGLFLTVMIFSSIFENKNQEKIYKEENKAYLNSVYEKFEKIKDNDNVIIGNENYNVWKTEEKNGKRTYWLKNKKGNEIITNLEGKSTKGTTYSEMVAFSYKDKNKSCTYIMNWNEEKYAFLNYSTDKPENINWIKTKTKDLTKILEKLMKEEISQCNENEKNIIKF